MHIVFPLTALSCVAICSSAHAATVTTFQQKVFVNRGSGYHAVVGTTDVQPGDSVMAGPKGSALITYDDGCKTSVDPGVVVAIGQTSPCPPATAATKAGAAAGTTAGTMGLGTYVIGAVAVGGAVGGALLLSKEKPASP
jgi:hypothetical protein